jgi:hypothetical protein
VFGRVLMANRVPEMVARFFVAFSDDPMALP